MTTIPRNVAPEFAWLLVFLPTLLYVSITRLGTSHEYGRLVGEGEGLYRVAEGFQDIADMTWRHDGELGRGYILLSEAFGNGRVWRWELGGGPISIGTTLHLEQSGCRSERCVIDQRGLAGSGSGALGIQFARDTDSAREGSLLVSEIGEDRIVRMEENGARTPLLLWRSLRQQNSLCGNPASSNIAHRMVMSATGDLIAVGEIQTETLTEETNEPSCLAIPALVVVPAIPRVPGLSSLELSREAHAWDTLNHTSSVFWSDPSVTFIGGLAVTETSLFVSVIRDNSPVILSLNIDDEHDETNGIAVERIYDLSKYGQIPGGLAITEGSSTLFTTVDSKLLRIESGEVTVISLSEPPTSLILGDDRYVYISSRTNLYRYFSNKHPHKLSTRSVVRPPSV